MLIDLSTLSEDLDREVDVCVIGSGAGGAVVAKELAETGREVVVVEEGGHFTSKDFHGPPMERAMKLYRNRGITGTLGLPPVVLPLGCTVGGTTTINSGTCFRTPSYVIEEWNQNSGLGLTPESLNSYYERVERELKVKPVWEEILGGNGRIVRKGAESLGWSHGPIRRNIDGCKGCGECGFGCTQNAKLGTNLTYIPKAVEAGATLFFHARARKISHMNGRISMIEGESARPRDDGRRIRFTLRPRHLILSGGTIYSPFLWKKSGLPDPSGQVGKNLTIHPGLKVLGKFDDRIEPWKGVLQSYYVDEFIRQGIMMEATGGPPELVAAGVPGWGLEHMAHMADYAHLGLNGIMISDTTRGRVISWGSRPFIWYQVNKADAETARLGLLKGTELMLAAGARWVETSYMGLGKLRSMDDLKAIESMPIKRRLLGMIAFHPMGTCQMGADPRRSVVDPNLKAHGYENLYVSDGSIFPTSLSVNPQITIMAFASRLSAHLAGRQLS
ncbi:MAG: GMC family oxidoreductase [Nitrospirae bacterium]|nr:GMC family oxidoreductase [Nitrospirota bacterium]